MKQKRKVIDKRCLIALSVAMAFTAGVGVADAATKDIHLVASWNLVNTPLQPTNNTIASVLNGKNYVSAWAWDAATQKWKVNLKDGTTAAYALSKGFGELTTIDAGNGFWLNMSTSGILTITGDAPSTAKSLVAGWNLVGSKVDAATSAAVVAGALKSAASDAVSLWKWQGSKWAVNLPGNTDAGAAYASSKGFALLTSIASTDGYWVNATLGGNTTDTPPQVGKVYETTGASTYVPLANAPVYKNGVQIGTTDSNGNFIMPPLAGNDVITVGEGNKYTISGSNINQNGGVYLFAQATGGNEVKLTPADVAPQKPEAKDVCSYNKKACLTISGMTLTEDISLAVTDYNDALALPNVAIITGLDPQYKVVAGGDVSFLNSKGKKINGSSFGGKVLAKASNFLSDLDGATLDQYINVTDKDGNKGIPLGSLEVLEYDANAGTWSKAGAGVAVLDKKATKLKQLDDQGKGVLDDQGNPIFVNGPPAYTIQSAPTSLTGLKPFVFVFKTDYLKGAIDVTVSNGGLVYKKAGLADEVVVSETQGKGVVKEESYGDKVVNAMVTTDSSATFVTTKDDGTAQIEYLLPPDNPNISLLIKKDGYFDTTATINVIEDKTKAVSMLEVPDTAAVGGIISDAQTQNGIAGAQVILKNPVVLDKVMDDGTTIQVGLDAKAGYKWEIKKQVEAPVTSGWVTIAENSKNPETAVPAETAKNSISRDEIKQALITGWSTLSAPDKEAIGANPVGTYDVRVTVTHPEDNGDYVESATGYLDITFDLSLLDQTGSLSSAFDFTDPTLPKLWGGASKGYYFAQGPMGVGSPKWQVKITSWDDLEGDGNKGVCSTVNPDPTKPCEVTTLAQTDLLDTPFVLFTEPINLIQKNYLKLLEAGNFQEPGVPSTDSYLKQGVTLRMEMNVSYSLGPDTFDFTGDEALPAWFDIQANDPLAPLVVGKLQMLPNTTMAFEEKQTTDAKGWYLFAYLDKQLSGKLEASAAAGGYFPKSLFLYEEQGYTLNIGEITAVDMALTPVLTPPEIIIDMPPTPGVTDAIDDTGNTVPVPVTGWFESFEDCAGINSSWGVVVNTDPVKWQCLTNPEDVGPAKGGVTYPLFDTTDTGANLPPAYSMMDTTGVEVASVGVAWFGNVGNAIINQGDSNYSSGAVSGTMTSPEIDLANYSFATLDFASWFEVESVDVAKWQFDQMKVEVAVVGATQENPVTVGDYTFTSADDYKIVTFMNPDTEPNTQDANLNFSSGGSNAVPVWIKKQANLNPFAGQKIKVRFNFNSQDSLFNGWRGWGLDNVAVINQDSGLPFTLEQSGYWWKAPARKP